MKPIKTPDTEAWSQSSLLSLKYRSDYENYDGKLHAIVSYRLATIYLVIVRFTPIIAVAAVFVGPTLSHDGLYSFDCKGSGLCGSWPNLLYCCDDVVNGMPRTNDAQFVSGYVTLYTSPNLVDDIFFILLLSLSYKPRKTCSVSLKGDLRLPLYKPIELGKAY